MERRLAAIMALDLVGYSRLMEKDEGRTLDLLKRLHADVLDPAVKEHNGRIFKITGDGALVQFGSAVDAVKSACQIQREMQHRAAGPDSGPLRLRIGINLGDVVLENDDVYGDGVNVASRLEGIAEAGAVYVSGPVYEISSKVLPYRFISVGSKHLKNISAPVRVYRVETDSGARITSRGQLILSRRRITGLAALLLLAAVLAAAYVAFAPSPEAFQPVAADAMALPLPAKPSIAVLPFDSSSADPGDDLIARGLAAGARQLLSEREGFFVIAENSSFQLEGAIGARISEAARQLGVRYVLSGRYTPQGAAASIDARLSDAIAGRDVWEGSFGLAADKVMRGQGEVTANVLAVLNLDKLDRNSPGNPPTDHLEAWLLHLRAQESWLQNTREHNAEARELWQQAYGRDPHFMLARLMIGWTEWADARFAWRADPFRSLERAERHAQAVLASESHLGQARELLASIYLQRMDHARASEFARQSVAEDPNGADAWARLATIEAFAGKAGEAREAVQTAMRLNPYYPAWYLLPKAEAYRLDGDHQMAIKTALEEIRRADNPYARLRLAIYFAEAGDHANALDQVQTARKQWPTLTVSDWGWLSRFADKRRTEGDHRILSQLGVPEFMDFDCMTRNECP